MGRANKDASLESCSFTLQYGVFSSCVFNNCIINIGSLSSGWLYYLAIICKVVKINCIVLVKCEFKTSNTIAK